MKKLSRILAVLFTGLFCLSASSCWFWGGWNGVMYKYFQDKDNYCEVTATFTDFHWVDESKLGTDRIAQSFYGDESEPFKNDGGDYDFFMVLSYIEDVSQGWIWWEGQRENVGFQICAQNAMELIENGFLGNVAVGDEITVRTTMWIYSDAEFFVINAVESGGVTYLDFDTGLQNYREFMDENRSLL